MPQFITESRAVASPYPKRRSPVGAVLHTVIVAGLTLPAMTGLSVLERLPLLSHSPAVAQPPAPVQIVAKRTGHYNRLLDANYSYRASMVAFAPLGGFDGMLDAGYTRGPTPRPFGQAKVLSASLRAPDPTVKVAALAISVPEAEDDEAPVLVPVALDPSPVPVPIPREVAVLDAPVPTPRPSDAPVMLAPEPVLPAAHMRSRRTRMANLPTQAPTSDNRSFFQRLFGGQQATGSALAYAPATDSPAPMRSQSTSPQLFRSATAPPQGTAIYDISAKTVYLPNGERLEAHSGFGEKRDDPRHVDVSMRGATPPHVYDLSEREQLFHGVAALRLNPVGGAGAIHGRAGLLAHTYMLGPKGDSNGCISFRNYERFLQAYRRGDVRRLVVVASAS